MKTEWLEIRCLTGLVLLISLTACKGQAPESRPDEAEPSRPGSTKQLPTRPRG